jgi:uncharacterized membrane protein
MHLPKGTVLGVAVFAAVGCGLVGGLLFAFSSFVMKALSQQPPESGMRTMQAINVHILNPLFLFVFLGTAAASAGLGMVAGLRLPSPGSAWLLAGCILYLVGAFGVTMIFNVPLNDRLATQNPGTAEAAQYWPVYVSQWLRWNHVRTVAALLATASFVLAIRQIRFPGE